MIYNQQLCEDGSMENEYIESDRPDGITDNSISFGGGMVIIRYDPNSQVTAQVTGLWRLPNDGSTEPENIKEDNTASIEEALSQERGKRISHIISLLIEASNEFFEEELVNLKESEKADKITRFDKSKEEARQFMEALPYSMSLPGVIPEPDGEIGLEWRDQKKAFLVTFEGASILSYAGYFGENDRVYGTKDFINKNIIPDNLLEYIHEVFSAHS